MASLKELSELYDDAYQLLRGRNKELRARYKASEDPNEKYALKRRMADLDPLLRQSKEMRDICLHYYEKGFFRNEKYTI